MTVLPIIRQQLLQAAERNVAAGEATFGQRWSHWRVLQRLSRATSLLATGAVVAVTVAIAVGAIVLIGHARPSPTANPAGPTSRQQLLQTLGVLRTSPTATDRAETACIERNGRRPGGARCLQFVPEPVLIGENPHLSDRLTLASMGNPKWDLALIRTIPLGRSGESVTIYPGSWRSFTDVPDPSVVGGVRTVPSSPPRTTWGIVATLTGHSSFAGESSSQTSGITLRTHGFVLMLWRPAAKTINVGIIVPDGVARITVEGVSLGGQHWHENVTAAVHNNVAAVHLSTDSSRFNGVQSASIQMKWFDAGGKVIRDTATPAQS